MHFVKCNETTCEKQHISLSIALGIRRWNVGMKNPWKVKQLNSHAPEDEDTWASTWYSEEAVKSVSDLRDLQKQ